MQAEHINPLQLPSNGPTGQIYTMLARDQGTPVHASGGNTNLYASQPFYLVHDPVTGEAFGVFLFNSNAMGEWGRADHHQPLAVDHPAPLQRHPLAPAFLHLPRVLLQTSCSSSRTRPARARRPRLRSRTACWAACECGTRQWLAASSLLLQRCLHPPSCCALYRCLLLRL